MARWGFHVGTATGTEPIEEISTGVKSRAFTRRLVGPDEISITANARQPVMAILDEWASDIWAYRDGLLVGRGRVLPTDDMLDEDRHTVSVGAKGYEAILSTRFIDPGDALSYNADQATILWNLVNLSQSRAGGALGVTQGSNGFAAGFGTTGVSKVRTYAVDQEIGKLCRQLAETDNGFDFEVDALKRLQVYYPSRGVSGQVLVFGSNIVKARRTFNWAAAANAVAVTGAAGTTRAAAVSATVATDPRGRIEARAAFGSIVESATLTQRATSLLAERVRPSYGWTLTLKRGWWGGFATLNVGDTVTLTVKSLPRLDVSVSARVYEIAVKIGPSGEEDVTVKVEEL